MSGKGSGSPAGVGLYLNGDLCRGSSTTSATFGNTGPISSTEEFECLHLEVWALVIPRLESNENTDPDISAALLGRFT